MGRRVICALTAGLLIPYVGTLAWSGMIHGEELRYMQQREASGKRRILLDRGGQPSVSMDMEEYLPGVLARQIPVEYEMETLKAQAVIARTYICRQMEAAGNGEEIAESALDMDIAEPGQLKRLWGNAAFPEYYRRLEEAVKATAGTVITYEGACIDPMFCRASAGMTRAGDSAHPYLAAAECPEDVEAEGFIQICTFSYGELAAAINAVPSAGGERQVREEALAQGIQIVSRDPSGYVEQLQIDGNLYTGEEVQYALGLQSSSFQTEAFPDGLRIAAKGIGHGYGFSQFCANARAKEGWKMEELLGYFYKNIVLISE